MSRVRPGIVISIFFALVFAFAAWQARDFPRLARIFPQYIAIAGLIVSVVSIIVDLRSPKPTARQRFADLAPESDIEPAVVYRRVFTYLTWFLGYYGLIWLIGFELATATFTATFLTISERVPLVRSLLLAAGVVLLVILLGEVLDLRWPVGRFGFDRPVRLGLF